MSVLQFNRVSQIYNQSENEVIALNNVSLTVEQGEFIAIIGPSGSGKSTFLSIAGALVKQSEGEVMLNGRKLTDLKSKELSKIRLKEIGFILQSSNLVPYLNVSDQLLVLSKMAGKITGTHKKYAKDLLEKLGLGKKLKKFPEHLSGGERQRVAIARAFMNGPSLILADEPTASLDTQKAYAVVQLIAKEVKARNKAAIMVTHDERMLEFCDKVYKIEDGKLSPVD